jgi:hypothetical protein
MIVIVVELNQMQARVTLVLLHRNYVERVVILRVSLVIQKIVLLLLSVMIVVQVCFHGDVHQSIAQMHVPVKEHLNRAQIVYVMSNISVVECRNNY